MTLAPRREARRSRSPLTLNPTRFPRLRSGKEWPNKEHCSAIEANVSRTAIVDSRVGSSSKLSDNSRASLGRCDWNVWKLRTANGLLTSRVHRFAWECHLTSGQRVKQMSGAVNTLQSSTATDRVPYERRHRKVAV